MSQRKSVLTSCVLFMGAATVAIACSSPAPEPPPDDEGGTGGSITPSTGGTSSTGGGGTTGDGGTGGGAGESGTDSCTGFSQTEVPSDFSACGGEPFGTWRSTGLGWTSWEDEARTNDDEPASLLGVKVAAEGGHRMKFHDGGELTWSVEEASVDQLYDLCPGTLVPLDEAFRQGCDWVGCGCVCNVEVDAGVASGNWTRTDTTLTVATLDAEVAFSYCVAEDEMTLVYPDGRTIVLERVYEVVTPTPCAGRDIEECVGACSAGQCVGDGDCAGADSEAECGTLADCAWDATLCSGDEQSSCTLDEYDRVPGCTFVSNAHCEGTPDPCWSMSEDACEEQLGCEAEWSCGGDPVPCSAAYGDQPMCEEFVGCTYDEDTYACEGPDARCEDLDAECGDYGNLVGCERSPCSGTATPCEDHDSLTCGQVQGCTLVID